MRDWCSSAIPAILCLAAALLLVPASGSRHRLRAFFGIQADRKFRFGKLIRVAAVATVVIVAPVGVGPMLAAAVVVGTLTVRFRRTRRDREHAVESTLLLDALEAVIGELRVGAHPAAAAEVAARESGGAAARAFAVGAARSRLGGSAADGVRDADAVIAPELTRVADAWSIAERHGLALADLLTAARTDLLGRVRFRSRTTAALAGPRASATVLSTLPLLGLALGQLMGANPLGILLTSPAGAILLPLGAALACTGLLWSDAITRKVLP
ncbi:type II secretion system F family protein [Nocardia puris]|nr:type II secretion system F family protein [Nocardia puris]MBF6216042.1 type II secretion system F family protein [Nocardia puris]MBF6366060.1 type II secretion system F family protein [Nocardia puris]MBF6460297.1 type II secretion system F family protein [Nocardia puris]